MKALSCVRVSAFEALFFFFAASAGVFFLATLGFSDTTRLFLETTAGFLSIALIRNFLWRKFICKKPRQKLSTMIIELAVFCVIAQTIIILLVPLSSVIPVGLLEKANVVRILHGDECTSRIKVTETKKLWNDSVSYQDVNITEGGFGHILFLLTKRGWLDPKNNLIRSASTFGSTIYFSDVSSSCPDEATFFHEMTHVWQFQTQRKRFFGITQVIPWVEYTYLQAINPDVLYDYGGEKGLLAAQKAGKKFLDFGIEQEAMIVEDWYYSTHNYSSGYEGIFTDQYKKLLQNYVAEINTP